MKTNNLPLLGDLNFGDFSDFLSWLAISPIAEFSVVQVKNKPPIRSSKINAMLKMLDQFGMIANKKERISITPAGREFANANAAIKKMILKNLFLSVESVQRIWVLVKNSTTGSIQKEVIHESLNLGSQSQIQATEVSAFISWAEACELFKYDKKKEEISLVDTDLSGRGTDPHGPGSKSPGLALAS